MLPLQKGTNSRANRAAGPAVIRGGGQQTQKHFLKPEYSGYLVPVHDGKSGVFKTKSDTVQVELENLAGAVSRATGKIPHEDSFYL